MLVTMNEVLQYANEKNIKYLQARKHYSFLKYIIKH